MRPVVWRPPAEPDPAERAGFKAVRRAKLFARPDTAPHLGHAADDPHALAATRIATPARKLPST